MKHYNKKKINIYDHMDEIMKALKKGITITTKSKDRVNTMTISWGGMGIEWNKPIFTTYVRRSRYTHEFLEQTGVFTVNIPIDDSAKKAITYVGTHSGRKEDKLVIAGLTPVDGETIDVPGLVELPITLECKVLFKQEQTLELMPEGFADKYYPEMTAEAIEKNGAHLKVGQRDVHIQYMAEIVNAYILEPMD